MRASYPSAGGGTRQTAAWVRRQRRPSGCKSLGFASTIFIPLAGLLAAHLGWRGALLALAVIHGLVTVPLQALTIRRPRTSAAPAPTDSNPPAHAQRRAIVNSAMRNARFWILTATFIAHGTATSTMTVHLVGYLISRSHPATATGLLGVLSVTGRLVLTAARRQLRVTTIVAAVFATQAAAILTMPLLAGSRTGAVITDGGFRLGFGVTSLATPALLADRYGTTAYASVAGRLAAPVTIAKATAPLAGAVLLHTTKGRLVTPAFVC
ncbi:MFS transporter [Micromonospora endolithica]|uniref:MFS transporter n=1 Tax=Micromonospora endolithica TaxID=230091 RepID=UPI002354D7FB|nr:MFS transporter [Micromonospora endolithica]